MARSDAGLRKALARIPELRDEFWHNLRIVGGNDELNQALEKANRISDFLELAELMCLDALNRMESCGGHFRVESQTPEGEAKRDDAHFSYTAAWEWKGPGQAPALHKEPLTFKYIPLSQRLQIAMNFTLKIWRQQSANASGKFVNYQIKDVTPEMSFLEMLDALNEDLINRGAPPVAFEHDCREGICGSCGFLINGVAHGGQRGTTVCQLSMRFFKDKDGEALTLEPWRARVSDVRDLIVNRSAFDRIIQAGGFISALREALRCQCDPWFRRRQRIPEPDAAACIGCGAVRRRLPQCSGHALHLSENYPSEFAAAGSAAARRADSQHGGRHG
jgi:succinate dehydrogenase/fumarate reductase-like Fe-S protein